MKEWKTRKEQFAAILKDLLNKAAEGRENREKGAPYSNGELMDLPEDGMALLGSELTRFSQEKASAESLVASLLPEMAKVALLQVLGQVIDSRYACHLYYI